MKILNRWVTMQNQEESGQRTRQVTTTHHCARTRWDLQTTAGPGMRECGAEVEASSRQLIFIDSEIPLSPDQLHPALL